MKLQYTAPARPYNRGIESQNTEVLQMKPTRKTAALPVRDMTAGSPLRLILAFAIPLFIGNIFQQLYTMADTMVVGRSLGDTAIAAVGATSSLYSLLLDLAIGMNSGFGIVVTRFFGAQDLPRLKRSIAGMIVLNLLITAGLTALSLAFLRPLLGYMNTPADILPQAHRYLAILCGGMLATVSYNMFSAILRAMGNSRSPLYFLILSSLLNMGLDLLFVLVLGQGVAGAAAATVIAQTVSALLCGRYVFRHYRPWLPGREDFRQIRPLLADLLSTGFAMALMLCVVDLGSTIFQRANNLLGPSFITAHTAARRIMGILMQPLGTIATANSTFAGQNWGAGKQDRVQKAFKQVLCLELIWSAFSIGATWLFGQGLVRFTTGTTTASVVENAVLFLRWHIAFFPFLAVLLCLRTTMQAIGRKAAPVLSSCIELAMKALAAWQLVPRLGFLGACVTEPITWVLMAVFLAAAYLVKSPRSLASGQAEPCQGPAQLSR